MEAKHILLIVIGIIFLIILGNYIGTLNILKKYKLKISEALSGIDVALSKRYNVITNLVEVVKGYTKHEKEVLLSVIKFRNNMSLNELKNINSSLDETMGKINIIIEKYPDIKANENFLNLQKAIIDSEEHLSASRRAYNANVSLYNEKVITFPSLIVAKIHGFKEAEYFKADEKEKEAKVNLYIDKFLFSLFFFE